MNIRSTIKLEERLSELQWELLDIGRALHVLEAFTRELHQRCRGKAFVIQNDPAWRMVFHTRDMFVIELAGFATGAIKSRLIEPLRTHHASQFPVYRPPSEGELLRLQKQYDEYHSAAFARIFEASKMPPPADEAFDGMAQRFRDGTKAIRVERSRDRAHRYENATTATDHMLDTKPLRGAYEFVTTFMNDIALVAGLRPLSFHDMNVFPSDVVAEGLVDDVLLGLRFDKRVDRDGLYAAMHAADPSGDNPSLFNGLAGREAMQLFMMTDSEWVKADPQARNSHLSDPSSSMTRPTR